MEDTKVGMPDLREMFRAGIQVIAESLEPGKGAFVSILAGTIPLVTVVEAVAGLTAPPGFSIELDHAGNPDVWTRDQEAGRFYSIFVRRDA